jgi:hypothetical protein
VAPAAANLTCHVPPHQLIDFGLLQGAGAVGVSEGWLLALHEHGHRRVLRAGAVAGGAGHMCVAQAGGDFV